MPEKLEGLHLADLHERAAKLGIARYRMLRREQLVAEIQGRDREAPKEASETESEGEPERESERERERLEDAETTEVVGVLEVTPQRYGFLRFRGLEAEPGDVYVSASQIRRCELR